MQVIKAHFILILLCHLSICRGFELDFFAYLDFELLDEQSYCEVFFDIPNLQFHVHDQNFSQLISFGNQRCEPALIIRPLKSDLINLPGVELECNLRSTFIKDPSITYMFLNDQNYDLDMFFHDWYSKMPCILQRGGAP